MKVAILGLGLMGGSLGLALKAQGGCRVLGYARRLATRKLAMKKKAVDEVFADPAEAVKEADIVVLCVPVLTIPEMIRKCRAHFASGCLVTDVGSTKSYVVAEAHKLLGRGPAVFIGSHPMVGSDETGLETARRDLYRDGMVIITPTPGSPRGAVKRVTMFWKKLGARISVMTPDAHDKIIARTSHVPHLAAAALVHSVLSGKDIGNARFCGSGFRDSTRIAGGSENIWHDIVKTNSKAVRVALADLANTIERLNRLLIKNDFEGIRAFLAKSSKIRRSIRKQ